MKAVKFIFLSIFLFVASALFANEPRMMFGDTSRKGVPFSKDPHVVSFGGRYLMYFSIPPHKDKPAGGWNIGIAESKDLINWQKVGEINPEAEYVARRIAGMIGKYSPSGEKLIKAGGTSSAI